MASGRDNRRTRRPFDQLPEDDGPLPDAFAARLRAGACCTDMILYISMVYDTHAGD